MGIVHERVLDVMCASLASRTRWDEPPEVYLFGLSMGRPHLHRMDVPDEVWGLTRPPLVLEQVAAEAEHRTGMLAAVAPPDLHAAGFCCETWSMRDETVPGTPEHARLDAAARAHRLHRHPDRIESRTMWVVDRAGITYMATWPRGESAPHRYTDFPGAGRDRARGAVPETLDRLVQALLGVSLPPRPGGAFRQARRRAR